MKILKWGFALQISLISQTFFKEKENFVHFINFR